MLVADVCLGLFEAVEFFDEAFSCPPAELLLVAMVLFVMIDVGIEARRERIHDHRGAKHPERVQVDGHPAFPGQREEP